MISITGELTYNFENVPLWEPLSRLHGYKIFGHACGEPHGNSIRTNPALSDFNTDNLVPGEYRKTLEFSSYNLNLFGEDFNEYKGRLYSAQFFYKKEKYDLLPSYTLMDCNGDFFGYYDMLGNDLYLHDFTHDEPNERTSWMVNLLLERIKTMFDTNNIPPF